MKRTGARVFGAGVMTRASLAFDYFSGFLTVIALSDSDGGREVYGSLRDQVSMLTACGHPWGLIHPSA